MKTLIVYYSRTGNTQVVAELIHAQVGGDLVALETKVPRPINYRDEVALNEREQNQGILPELKNTMPNFDQYQRIFIGAPTWSMALPQTMVTFLKTHDWAGKIVCPFNTHGGYGAGQIVDQLAATINGATILPILSVAGGQEANGQSLTIEGVTKENIAQKVIAWLQQADQ